MTQRSSESEQVAQFMDLFGGHHLALYRYIFALAPRVQDAEEVMQEVSKVLWEHFDEYEPGTNFWAWARRIAQLRVLEHRRKTARQALLPDDVLEMLALEIESQPASPSERAVALEACVERLRAGDRELIERRYVQGATVKGLAASLDRPVNSVSKSLERIRHALLDCIERRLAAAAREGGGE